MLKRIPSTIANVAVFVGILVLMYLIAIAGNAVWERGQHPHAQEDLKRTYRRDIQTCIVDTIESEVSYFSKHGYTTFSNYKKIVDFCDGILAMTAGQKFTPTRYQPTFDDLIKSHPQVAGTIRAYVQLKGS